MNNTNYITAGQAESIRDSLTVANSRDLSVQWEEWEQHTFFGSARAKLESGSYNIKARFPFDGSKEDLNQWKSDLNGWRDWLWRSVWPSNLRSLRLYRRSGPEYGYDDTSPMKPEEVPAIYTVDVEALRIEGKTVNGGITSNRLNPGRQPITIEFWFKVEDLEESSTFWTPISTHRNIDGEGWTLLVRTPEAGRLEFAGVLSLAGTLSPTEPYLVSAAKTTTLELDLSVWHHVAVQWSSADSGRQIGFTVNGRLVSTENEINEIRLASGVWQSNPVDPHWIGWAPAVQADRNGSADGRWVCRDTGGFLVDEYRVWHSQRSLREIEETRYSTVWATPGLVLQYRFNDSPETLLNFQGVLLDGVLDSSGSRLHGQRQSRLGNYDPGLELALERPLVVRERAEEHPCIYPTDSTLEAILGPLRASAAIYDESNPNLITRLVPSHYFTNPYGLPATELQTGSLADEAQDGAFLLASILHTWADFWDDMRLRADATITALRLNQDGTGSARPLLPLIAKENGLSLPLVFEDMAPEAWDETYEQVQEGVWRRVLAALPEVLRRKGTVSAIRALLGTVGTTQADGFVRIREYGFESATTDAAREALTQQLRFAIAMPGQPRARIRFARSRLA